VSVRALIVNDSTRWTHKTGQARRKAKHNNSVQNANVNAEFKGIGRDNAEQFARKCLMFNPATILIDSLCFSHQELLKGPTTWE
jgi:hypothetical protein